MSAMTPARLVQSPAPTRTTTSSGSSKPASATFSVSTYIQDAEREGEMELAVFFRLAQGESRKGAEQGEALPPKSFVAVGCEARHAARMTVCRSSC
jgi:hypothetical protein